MKSLPVLVVAMMVPCLILTGCMSWVAVKPSELHKLNNMTVGIVKSGPGAGRTVAVSVTKLERTDGRLIEVKGKPYIRVTANNEIYSFNPPLNITRQGSLVVIKSDNRGESNHIDPILRGA